MVVADLAVGDRVSREGREPGDPPRVGTVIAVYQSTPSGVGASHTLYDVRWDVGELVVKGYMRWGLTKLPADTRVQTNRFHKVRGVDLPARLPKLRDGRHD